MVWLSKVSLLPTSPTRADSDPSSSPTRLSIRESAAGAASRRASHDDPTGSAYTRRDECGSRPAHRDVLLVAKSAHLHPLDDRAS
jgi:hypothetical protein